MRSSDTRASRIVRFLLYPLAVFAAACAAAEAVIHVLAFMESKLALKIDVLVIQLGLAGAVVLALFVSSAVAWKALGDDPWDAAIDGCPAWARWALGFLFAYSVANFVFYIVQMRHAAPSIEPTARVLRCVSGFALALYSAIFALLYSAIRTDSAARR